MSGAVAGAVPISIHEWMRSACQLPSTSVYAESAVELALALTRHLYLTAAASAEALEVRITAENVLVFVARLPPGTAGRAPPIVAVEFRVGAGAPAPSAAASPRPRALCVALGTMLLGIFSMGRASSLEECVARDPSPPCAPRNRAGKRRAVALPSAAAPEVARRLLLSLGMPLSICQLVGDLLEAGADAHSDVALTSLEEALWDLTHMHASPHAFLFRRPSPQQALVDTRLFGNTDTHLIGRERVTEALMASKNNVAAHVRTGSDANYQASSEGGDFFCEAAFLSGYAGSGKSSLLHSAAQACKNDHWFVLGCKFDQQSAPHMILAKAFDDFFGKWNTRDSGTHSDLNPIATVPPFNKVCRRIFLAMDDEGLRQLGDLVPNFTKIFPLLRGRIHAQERDGISSMDKIGSAKKRRRNMFNILFEALCSAGRPVLFTLDDLQWSQSCAIDDIADFVASYVHDAGDACRRGLFVVGTFRSNQVDEGDALTNSIASMKESGRARVTVVPIGEISKTHVTKLISSKLCLPWRYTRKLAALVHAKTRGNPFFVVQFLRSIIRNNMLSFSVESQRWIWDCDVVDMQMISDGVAQLLTTTFSQLPSTLMQTLKVVACLGSQVEVSTIESLDAGNALLSFNMEQELPLAVKEGILEKAGPVYQFTHDIVQQTIYELVPSHIRNYLHKAIGANLLKSGMTHLPTIHLLAVDQINIYCKGGALDPEERSQFANSNVVAAKSAIGASSFEQARLYIDMGIHLLETQHWETQYCLSLDLYEMSASVSFMHGDISTMSTCLDEIISRVRSFDDSLKALSLRAKLLASSSKFEDARSTCLLVLKNLGEEFPHEVDLHLIQNTLSWMKSTLKDITSNQIKLLPPMTDKTKLNAMKFLNMICMYSKISKPTLLPIFSCRMVTLTIEYGFCDDSIVGLATIAHSLLLFAEDFHLASRIGKVSESLSVESPNRHMLRPRLCNEIVSSIKLFMEPSRSVLPIYSELYNSAMMVGDVENAMFCRWGYCVMIFWAGESELSSASKQISNCIKEAVKYQQHTVLYSTMSLMNTCLYLTGRTSIEVDVKSFDELDNIGEGGQFLVWQNFIHRLAGHFWMREYKDVAELTETFSANHPSSPQIRIMNVFRTLYEGIAHLHLARDTKQAKWKALGNISVMWMSKLALMTTSNFENKAKLLQAELHYLEGDLISADAAYTASIKFAHDQKYNHEEALACELYGIFCVENNLAAKGSEQLHNALNMYKCWGATRKVADLQLFIDMITFSY